MSAPLAPHGVAGIILAAGRSTRMGGNKLLLDYRGKPILQHVIDTALGASLAPLVLVLGAEDDRIRSRVDTTGVEVVINANHDQGYATSLQAGLDALDKPCSGAMFLLGDQPLVTGGTIEKLLAAFSAEPERWVAPCCRGRRGNPVITPSCRFDKIYALTGDTGPRAHLKDPAARLKLVEVDDIGVIFDIDRPEDYERLCRM